MHRRVLLSVVLVPVVLSSAAGQEEKLSGQSEPARAAVKPAEPKRPGVPGHQEHVIYVPYNKLAEVFEKEGASVLLPYAQVLQMWSGLQGPLVPLPIKPPVAGLITRSDYVGKVDGDLVRLQATLTIEVLGDEWAKLPVQFGDAAVGEAKSDDEEVLLRGVGDGNYELLARGRGRHTISFGLVARVQSSADGRSFMMKCPPVGVSNLELEIPQTDLSVEVSPRRTSQILGADQRVTKVQAVLGSTDRFSVAWQPKSGAAVEMVGLASASDTITIEVGDGIVHTHAVIDYQILRGSLDTLAVTMPAGERLLDVQAPGLRDWQTEAVEEPDEGGTARQRLVVRLHAAVRDRVRLEIRTESPIPDADFPVAQLQVVGVARESGIIAVRSAEDVGLAFVAHTGVSRIDAAEVPEPLRKPRSTFYKFFSPTFRLTVAASALEPRVAVETSLTVTIDKSRLSVRGDFAFDVSRAGIFTVPLRMPAGFAVDEVQCDAMDRHETSADEDGQVLTVFLTKKVLGQLRLSVVASQPRTAPSGELELPLLEPVGVPREQGLVAVIAPDSIEVNSDPTKLESARAATPAELAARGFNPQPPQGSTVAAAFAFSKRPVRIGLAARQRARRVAATVTTIAAVKENVLNVTTKITYDTQYAGTDTFRLAAPPSAEKLKIDGEAIRETRKADQPESDGTVLWTIVLHSEATGQRTFTATYDEKISVSERGVTQTIQPIKALDVDTETGEIAILKDRALAIAATPVGLEEIDSRELAQPIGNEQPYLSYRYFRHPARLALDVTKHEIEGVVKTIVSRAYVEAVLSAEGPISVRARYWVKSTERQRLALTLPATRILGVTVAGRSVLPEKAPAMPGAPAEDKSYFINIDRTTGPDDPFPIAIIYEAPPPQGGKLATTDRLALRLPQFEKGVKFQLLYVRLWVPDQFRTVGEPPGFTAETRTVLNPYGIEQVNYAADDPDAWFPGDTTKFDFRTAGHAYLYSSLNPPGEMAVRYWKTAPMALAASVAALAIGVALVFVRLETRIVLVFVAVLVALLAGMFWPDAVTSWLVAARIGLAAVLGLWLVMFLLRIRHAIPLRAAAAAAGAGTVLLSTVGSSAPASPVAPPPSESAAEKPEAAAQPPPGQPQSPTPDHPSSDSDTPGQKGGSHE